MKIDKVNKQHVKITFFVTNYCSCLLNVVETNELGFTNKKRPSFQFSQQRIHIVTYFRTKLGKFFQILCLLCIFDSLPLHKLLVLNLFSNKDTVVKYLKRFSNLLKGFSDTTCSTSTLEEHRHNEARLKTFSKIDFLFQHADVVEFDWAHNTFNGIPSRFLFSHQIHVWEIDTEPRWTTTLIITTTLYLTLSRWLIVLHGFDVKYSSVTIQMWFGKILD